MTTQLGPTPRRPGPHGIDLYAPGGIDALLDFHRATFGDAQMNANASGSGDNVGTDSAGDGNGPGGQRGDQSNGSSGEDDGQNDDPDKGAKSALAAERKRADDLRRELGEKTARIKELEDAGKTDEERREQAQKDLQTENTSLKSTVEQKDALLLRYEVAAEKGLNLAAAKRLQGATREEIEADADEWLQLWGPGADSKREDPGRGDRGQGQRGGQKESSYEQGAQRARIRYQQNQQQ